MHSSAYGAPLDSVAYYWRYLDSTMDTLIFLERSPKLIPLKDAAKLIGVHYETLRLWAKLGRIAHIRCGNRIKFRPGALRKWLTDRETGGQP